MMDDGMMYEIDVWISIWIWIYACDAIIRLD